MGDENRAGLFMFGPGGLRESGRTYGKAFWSQVRCLVTRMVFLGMVWYVIWSHTAFTSCKAIGALPVGKLCLTKLYSDC